MIKKSKLFLFSVASLLLLTMLLSAVPPAPIFAATGTNVGSLSMVSTIENICVYSNFSGDDNDNNQAIIEYRQVGLSTWQQGIPMTVDRRVNFNDSPSPRANQWCNQWRVVIFWLIPDTEYEVRVTYTDPDGVTGTNPVTATIRTKNDNPPSNGTNYYVSTTGSDSNNGLTTTSAFRTIQHAADVVGPGDIVNIMPGTYHEQILIIGVSGTANNYITFRSYDMNNKAIIDGQKSQDVGFDLEYSSYIRISGLVLQNTNENNVQLFSGANYCIIEDCIMSEGGEGWGHGGMLINWAGHEPVVGTLIQRNEITRYAAARDQEMGIFFYNASIHEGGFVIRDNVIKGVFRDGIGGSPNGDPAGTVHANTMIYRNYIEGSSDDCIEIEGANLNCALWSNTLVDGKMAFGVAPIQMGPIYFFRNVTIGINDADVKMGGHSDGYGYFYHNTFYHNSHTNGAADFGWTNIVDNLVFRNNIFYMGKYAIYHRQDDTTNSYDYDNLFKEGGGDVVRYGPTLDTDTYTLSGFRSVSGNEMHGISADPRFTNTGSDFSLQSNSPCIDEGVVLTGFNDANSPWPYSGSAPDIGAYEYGSGPPTNTPPEAANDSYNVSEDATLNTAAPGVLNNDTDSDGDSLTAVKVSSPAHGTVTLNADGSFTYTPEANYSGTDSFTYRAYDGHVNSNIATVSITINAVNDAPMAVDDAYVTSKDTTRIVAAPGVLGNDTDADGNQLTAAKVSDPSHGTLTLNADGSFTYTPSSGYSGTDSFTYRANDGQVDSNTATVTITINAVNESPVAVNDSYSAVKDNVFNLTAPGVLGNDTDNEGNPLTAIKISDPSHGTLTLNSNGSFIYTPSAGYTGSDTFTYKANDGNSDSNVATVTINTFEPVHTFGLDSGDNTWNQSANQLIGTRYLNSSNGGILIKLELLFDDTTPTGNVRLGVYADDSGSPGALLLDAGEAAVANGWVSKGGLSLSVTGDTYYWLVFLLQSQNEVKRQSGGPANSGCWRLGVNYGELPDPFGAVSGFENENYVMRATITVSTENIAPVAVDDVYTTNQDNTLTVSAPGVLSNDTDVNGDTLTAVKVSNTAHGTVTLNSNGSFTYTPTSGYTGSDSFTYQANDGQINSNTATVTITVTETNDTPVATNDSYTTSEDTPLTIPASGVLGNDTDANGDTLTAVKISNPSHGTVTLNSNGSFTYTPTANYNGTDSFTYRANDGQANSNTATVSITVTEVNDTPVAANDSYSTGEDTPLTVSAPGVLGNDTDANGDTLTAAKVSNPSHGTVIINSNGSFTYTPDAGYTGTDTFTYRANDGQANSNTAIVTITINSDNSAPVAAGDTYTTNKDATLIVTAPGVLGNDDDANSDTLTAVKVSNPSHGTLNFNANGSFTYIPFSGYSGDDSFSYCASDGQSNSNAVTVTITVEGTPENPTPTPIGDGGEGGASGGGSGGIGGVTSLRGSMTADGLMVDSVSAADIDLKFKLYITEGTVVQNKFGQAPGIITISNTGAVSVGGPGSILISGVYNFGPDGITFESSATLIYRYSEDEIPEGVPTTNLYIAYLDPETMTWKELGGIVNTEERTVSTQITHLSTYAVMAHNRPANFETIDFVITPEEVVTGDIVQASVMVNNTGDLAGSCEVNLVLDNKVVQTKVISINGGDGETVTFTLNPHEIGEHRASIGAMSASFSVKKLPVPADFTLSELTIEPVSALAGEDVSISVRVNNTGDLSGDYQAVLIIDGTELEMRDIALTGGSSEVVVFSVTPHTTGEYEVNIGNLTATFEVQPVPPTVIAEAVTPELNRFSATPVYNEDTNTLVFTRVVYQMNEPWDTLTDTRLMLTVFGDGQFLEQIPLLTLAQLQPDGVTGELNYIPSSGWEVGEYSFRAELYKGEDLIQDTPITRFNVTSEDMTRIVSWKTLGIIIGISLALGFVIVSLVLYFKRDMMRDYQK